jgi:hypothetical protein
MMEIPDGQEHTVFLLGAGFSAERGLPMMDGFVYKMIEANGWLRKEGREEESAAIRELLTYRHDISSASLRCTIRPDNIEDLLSAAAAEPADSYRGLDKNIKTAIAATLDYTEKQTRMPKGIGILLDHTDMGSKTLPPSWDKDGYEKINPHGPKNTAIAPIYDFYVSALTNRLYDGDNGDYTFITYNYDMLLERSLNDLSIPMSYGFSVNEIAADTRAGGFIANGVDWNVPLDRCTSDCVKVLKMHGSVNWALERATDNPYLHIKEEYDPSFGGLEGFIQPPTWQKRQNSRGGGEVDGGLLSLWSNAIKALSIATKIVVIGYSFPTTDYYVKSMFQIGLKNNIGLRKFLVVNPSLSSENYGEKSKADYLSRMHTIFNEQFMSSGIVEFIPYRLRDVLATAAGSQNPSSLFRAFNPQSEGRLMPFSSI